MKAIVFAVFAVALYAAQNVIIPRKLAGVSPLANMLGFYVVLVAVTVPAVLASRAAGSQLTLPQGGQWLWLGLCAVLLFTADFFLFSAYSAGVKLVTMTMLAVLLPVFASIINAVTGGGVDISARTVLAWVLAAISVWLVAK